LQFFKRDSSPRWRRWFYAILVTELLFGFLSGFKSAVAIPVLIAAVCQYIQTGRFSKNWIILVFVAMTTAYAVIEPFRAVSNQNVDSKKNSLESIVSTMTSALTADVKDATSHVSTLLAISSRSNLSYIGAFGIEYADRNSAFPAGSPDFLANIFLAPLHAWIPRVIWKSKPLGNLGLWYNQVVMENSHFSSTAMGPVTYLYFAGGFIAVFAGFFCIGILHRSLFFLMQPAASVAGAMVFMATLQILVSVDSSINGMVVTLCRELPLLLILQLLLFRRPLSRRSFENLSLPSPRHGGI